jgi:hypothetical protein
VSVLSSIPGLDQLSFVHSSWPWQDS